MTININSIKKYYRGECDDSASIASTDTDAPSTCNAGSANEYWIIIDTAHRKK